MAAAAVSLSMTGAQTWDTGRGTYTLKSCAPSAAAIKCDFGFVYAASESINSQLNIINFEAVGPDGKTYKAKQLSVGGQPLSERPQNQTFYKGVSVPITVVFDAPSTMASFQVLAVQRIPVNNVPVRGVTPPPAPTPVPSPAPSNPANYTAVLSNCKTDAKGVMTCTAVLTPRR